VRRNQWKLYEGYEGVPVQLYDVVGDKGETRNVAAGNAAVVGGQRRRGGRATPPWCKR
jgi:hypothetical protein